MFQGPDHHRAPAGSIYRFGDVEVDPSQGCLKRSGQEIHLRQQSFHVLLYLLKHRDRLVGKNELVQEFWHETAVTDNAVVQCITDIRKAIGDDSRNPRLVRTIPKVGYRFIGRADEIPVTPEPEPAASDARAPVKPGAFRPRWLVLAALGVALAFGWLALQLGGHAPSHAKELLARRPAAPQHEIRKPDPGDELTKNPEAYRDYSLGVAKARGFENAEAIALFKKAIRLDPQFAMAYARIGYAYSVTGFLPEKGRPYLEKALQLSGRLSAKDKVYVTAWSAIARADYSAAIRTLRQLVARYPLEIEAYARLARLLYREERPRDAIGIVQQALAIKPDAGDLYNVLGVCFLGMKRYGDAIAAHQRYVQLSPNEPNAHDSLGMSFEQSGSYGDALAEYRTALLLDPKFEPAIIHVADTYAQQGRFHAAIQQYERYIQLAQSGQAKAIAYGDIACLYRRLHDFPQAGKAAAEEIGSDPGAVWNSLLLALRNGDAPASEDLREKLFENTPDPERGARNELRSYDYDLGVLALRNGQSKEAIAHFEDALRHLPPSSGLDLHEDCLGNAYLALGRSVAALQEYRRIQKSNPNYPLLHYHMAQAFERENKNKEAQEEYRRFLNAWKQADRDIPQVKEARRRLDRSNF